MRWQPCERAIALATLSAVLLASPATAQHRGSAAAIALRDTVRAELLSPLVHTRIHVRFDRTPVREALVCLSKAAGITIVGRFNDDRTGEGLDPSVRIVFEVSDRSVLEVLELILGQCEMEEPLTWQLRREFVEVGTKDRLSAPAAMESRIYPIGDLLIEPPYIEAPTITELLDGRPPGPPRKTPSGTLRGWEVDQKFSEHPYATAALSLPVPQIEGDYREMMARKTPDQTAEEIVWAIVELVEPGNWYVAPIGEDGSTPVADPSKPGGHRPGHDKIASIRLWRDRVSVRAPDFVHRQVAGYPVARPPVPLRESERQARSAAASTETALVDVLATTRR